MLIAIKGESSTRRHVRAQDVGLDESSARSMHSPEVLRFQQNRYALGIDVEASVDVDRSIGSGKFA